MTPEQTEAARASLEAMYRRSLDRLTTAQRADLDGILECHLPARVVTACRSCGGHGLVVTSHTIREQPTWHGGFDVTDTHESYCGCAAGAALERTDKEKSARAATLTDW